MFLVSARRVFSESLVREKRRAGRVGRASRMRRICLQHRQIWVETNLAVASQAFVSKGFFAPATTRS